MKKYLVLLFSLLSFSAFATHERAGEITYRHLGGLTYQISVTTYTKGSSWQADKCTITVNFGSSAGDTAVVCRSNYEPGDPSQDAWQANGCTGTNPYCTTHHMGEWNIGTPKLKDLDIKKNVYTTTHTYPGPGVYIISMTDPNRNKDIVNVPDLTPISVQDTLVIYNAFGMPTFNNSVVLTNPPIDKACIGVCFIHNPGAVDPDGDSLSYKLGVCFQGAGTPIPAPAYFIPNGVTVNPYTGDLSWCNPPPQKLSPPYNTPYEYNFAMDIQEWKLNVVTKKRYLVGTVRRDMQVKVYDCDNKPPLISNVKDTCIEANTNLSFTITATDPGNNVIYSFTATGDPFKATPVATFSSDAPIQSPSTGFFSWAPTCNQIRLQPYKITFKVLDDGAPDNPPVPLSDYKTFFVRVIAPAPKNLTAAPQCTNMLLRWDVALCNPLTNPLFNYKVYRKIGCDTLKPNYCETGMPASWGYQLIATLPNTTLTYTDNNGGAGLVPGSDYSYRVVAFYRDGAQSYVSNYICKHIVRDVPILTNVDVISTSVTGSINIKWLMPIPSTINYDTTLISNHGPYRIEIMRGAGYTPPTYTVSTIGSQFFATLNTTTFLDSPLNTKDNVFSYNINFYDSINASCPAQKASSVFLSCKPSDNQIQISWNEHVPWTNYRYDVYKLNPVSNNWDSIATTTQQLFTDIGLVNGSKYCYKVKSIGAYPDTSLLSPLINWSQELCCSPVDLTPPCANELAVDSSCILSANILKWTNPNNSCSDDALYYIIYHKDSITGEYLVLDTIHTINTTTYLDDSLFSIAGCYAVTSVDSFKNESKYSNIVCIDNCPYYQLPNVFTPNGDGVNDFFIPLHPYKYVQRIDINIYNRWGTEVFHAFDPEILWNGKSIQTKMECSDGVYYYVCIVYDIRLKGIIPHVLTGNIHLLRN
jgi:gliding motility-associated-like protein